MRQAVGLQSKSVTFSNGVALDSSERGLSLERILKWVARATRPPRSATGRPELPRAALRKGYLTMARTVASIPSGESPDGTGQWPVLPKTEFSNTLLLALGGPSPKEACAGYENVFLNPLEETA